MYARKITTAALLTAVALTIFVVEAQIPPPLPLPGVKLGLSNAVTLFALFFTGPGVAALVLAARILLGGLLTGQAFAMLYSAAGGLLSFAATACIYRRFPLRQVFVVSMISAVLHNLGQLAAAAATSSGAVFVYLPVLVAAGLVTGLFTGLCAQFVLLRAQKLHLDESAMRPPDRSTGGLRAERAEEKTR